VNSNGLEVGGGMEWAGLAWSHVGRVPKYQVRKKKQNSAALVRFYEKTKIDIFGSVFSGFLGQSKSIKSQI